MGPGDSVTCDSTEQFERLIAPFLDLECTQSEAGLTSISMLTREVQGSLVYSTRSSRKLLLRGTRARDWWTLAPVCETRAGASALGRPLEQGDLLLLNPGGEAFQQIAPDHRQYAISIPVAAARETFEIEHQLCADRYLDAWGVQSGEGSAAGVDRLLKALLFSMSEDDDEAIVSRLISLVIGDRLPQAARSPLLRRRRIVSHAEELIRSRLHAPPSVRELCEATNSSRRTLFYAFMTLLGRSPIQHAKMLRLHAARRRILSSGEALPIRLVAEELGFWYPGQFAADYRRLFGEAPSLTLKTAAGTGSGQKKG
jgi:AraC-like DNA-binding protein